MSHSVTCVLDAKATLGEGAVWDDRAGLLYWVDIEGCKLHAFDPRKNQNTPWDIGQMVGTVVPIAGNPLPRKVLLALHHGIGTFDLDSKRLVIHADPEKLPGVTRFNDGKCDPQGRFWAGTLGTGKHSGTPVGSLYRFDPDHSVHKIADKIVCSNGIVWPSDHATMYYIDTPLRRVDAFDYDPGSGDVKNRRVAFDLKDFTGYPDGMTIDHKDRLWIAFWAGWCVRCFDPLTGQCLHEVKLPCERVTSCAFGGPTLEDLYITTARTGLKPDQLESQPLAGGLFVTRPGQIAGAIAKGIPACRFAGACE
ncbi:MAG: SMP-30/gluconolactonase/LRE family protein [Phycisphaera sp.]|nr:SMP-30/gluconolactonase/LRE family protein [Phycisphaera sp.]